MHLTSSGARALIAIVAMTGVTGAAATSASASKARTKHATSAHKNPARADLLARGLHVDFSDTGFAVSASIANTGGRAAASSDAVIAISDDTIFDSGDDVLEEYSLPRILPGVQRDLEIDAPIPDDLPGGTLYLIVCADGNTDVREKDETNNCVSQEIDSTDSASTDPSSDGSVDDGADNHGIASGDTSGAVIVDDGQ